MVMCNVADVPMLSDPGKYCMVTRSGATGAAWATAIFMASFCMRKLWTSKGFHWRASSGLVLQYFKRTDVCVWWSLIILAFSYLQLAKQSLLDRRVVLIDAAQQWWKVRLFSTSFPIKCCKNILVPPKHVLEGVQYFCSFLHFYACNFHY